MKTYVSPEFETIRYKTEDCLSDSDGVKKNGPYNIEFDLPEWTEEIIK